MAIAWEQALPPTNYQEDPVKQFRLWMTTYIARSDSRPAAFERHPWLLG